MIVLPIAASAVSALFSGLLFRQYARAKRLPQLAWGIALAQFAIASLTVAMGVGGGWDPTLYRLFWLFGAVLNVPWLAVGSISLVSSRAVGLLAAAAAVALTVVSSVMVAGARADLDALAGEEGIPRGKEIWAEAADVLSLGRWSSILAWVIVVGIAAWSSRSRRGMRPSPARVRGNILIAAGTSIVAIGGFALGRVGRGSAFSMALAAGVAVMFAGFLLASRPARFHLEEPGDSPT